MLAANLKQLFNTFRLTILIFVAVLAIALPAAAQDDKQAEKQRKDEQKRQEKAAKQEEKAAKIDAKNERLYQEIKSYSRNKYNTDPIFKDAVDNRYREIRRSHIESAYSINMRPSNSKLVNRDGEKLVFEDTLYDNPLAQDYINRVGQSLVPASSKNLYAFRILQNPVPEARSMSTGTVYISTGYLAAVDNEAQLAYILGHEISHVEKEHWFEDALVSLGAQAYQEAKARKAAIIGSIVGGVIGGIAGGGDGAVNGAYLAIALAPTVSKLFSPGIVNWEKAQEDEADIESMRYMFNRNYDVREVPKFYERMATMTADPRTQTGFIAAPDRVKERLAAYGSASAQFIKNGALAGSIDVAQNRKAFTGGGDKGKNLAVTGARGIARMLNETLAPDIQKKLDAGELIAGEPEFSNVMALIKRDNGIRAFQFDMFQMARTNLEDSIANRSTDPSAYYYYGKVLKQTARNPTEVSKALENLSQAVALDQRQTIAEPYLYRAMLRLTERNPNEINSIINDLKTYVTIYQRENAGTLPPNMEFIYDFMQDMGATTYRASPAMNVATKDIDPIRVAGGSSQPAVQNVSQPAASPARLRGKQ
ncbi:MAG: beta-barrel assembly-enhancing protease [Pyrinomonadaceae bacterium]|nr:beta-barrel assembly-enhancing protease [Pyrinomonadaceae bacterium]